MADTDAGPVSAKQASGSAALADVAQTPSVITPTPRRLRRSRLRRPLLLLGPVLVGVTALYFYSIGGRYVNTENAYVKADSVAVSARVAGVINQISISENQVVEADAVLFRLDAAPFELFLRRADAELAKTVNDRRSLKAAYRQKQEELALARSNMTYAAQELQRQTGLAKKNMVSASSLDDARHAADVTARQYAALSQALARNLAELGGDPDAPVENHPDYLMAKAARDQAALDLSYTVIRAPFAGVASKTPERGRYVDAGIPVMSVVAYSNVWIEVNLKETQLTHVKPGQRATVTIDAYPRQAWLATVHSISQATGAEFSVLPPQNATGNWVKVVQRIPVRLHLQDIGAETHSSLRAGMSASVSIDTEQRRVLAVIGEHILIWLQERLSPSVSKAAAAARS